MSRMGRKTIFLKRSKFITLYSFNSQKLALWWWYVADTYSVKMRQIFIYNLYYKIYFVKQNFMLKIKKRKMHFWTPKILFHTNLWNKLCSTQKKFLKKYPQMIEKRSGGNVLGAQNHEIQSFWGALTFPPGRFFYILTIPL